MGRLGPTDRIAGLAAIVTVAGMIATPLQPRGGHARRVLSNVVVSGLFAVTTANAARRWGSKRALTAAGTIAAATTAVERVGTATGVPFGRYAYTRALQPQVAHVPLIVPLAWFAMALPARDTAHATLGASSTRATRAVLGSAALTAWDLFLDPQMVGEGYWAWARRGVYRGIPLTNFLGWFATGLAVMSALDTLLPVKVVPGTTATPTHDIRSVGTYAYMGVMETVGFARYFRDPLVAIVGGVAMLPLAATAVVRTVTGR
ncbi:MAG: carotenoid biosynthesis protein [Ilumatobacter sp.]|nr:carotenoid biosynthesis protein [Ilumatobacter sp.]